MAKNESIYFSHDADAMNDPKCMLLISQMGMEGYGAFWALVELLRVQPEYKMSLALVPAIAARLQITEAKLKTVISAFGLFLVTEDSFFFSQSLCNRMQLMVEKSERRKISATNAINVRWEKHKALANSEIYESDTNVLRTKYDSILKKRKEINLEKESIKKKAVAFIPPQISEIEEYCKERNNKVDANRFYDFYESKGWLVGKNKMKDWKAAVRTWEQGDKTKQQKNQSHENSKQYPKL